MRPKTKVDKMPRVPVASKSLVGLRAEKFVEKMLRAMMKVPSNQRASMWEEALKKQPKEIRHVLIDIRRRRARIRKGIRDGVNEAVNVVSKRFPEFKGVLFFGSLAEARENHHKNFDLDVIPITAGAGKNILNPDAYDLLSKLIQEKTQVKLHGLEMFASFKGDFRRTLFSLDVSNIGEAKKALLEVKRTGFVSSHNHGNEVHFASYNFFGDKNTLKRLEKIVD